MSKKRNPIQSNYKKVPAAPPQVAVQRFARGGEQSSGPWPC